MNIDTATLFTTISKYVSKDNIVPFIESLKINIESILKSDLVSWVTNPFKNDYCEIECGDVSPDSILNEDVVFELMYRYAEKNHWYYSADARGFYKDIEAIANICSANLHHTAMFPREMLQLVYRENDIKKVRKDEYDRINEYLVNTLHVDEESIKNGSPRLNAEQLAKFYIHEGYYWKL